MCVGVAACEAAFPPRHRRTDWKPTCILTAIDSELSSLSSSLSTISFFNVRLQSLWTHREKGRRRMGKRGIREEWVRRCVIHFAFFFFSQEEMSATRLDGAEKQAWLGFLGLLPDRKIITPLFYLRLYWVWQWLGTLAGKQSNLIESHGRPMALVSRQSRFCWAGENCFPDSRFFNSLWSK